eukprot:TRINITY_DN6952_c0_g1_i2.p1 TRINITY_DN6952_c0_g1~~TRINITY_DN6952_c0_g1_i2.p1  ORF type:complete len:770 (-),score=145.78 TRINITY_DN6952_c0_g1_i2:1222-3531(-)
MIFSGRVFSFFTFQRAASLKLAILPDLEDSDKRMKEIKKLAHNTFKDLLQTYLVYFDLNLTHFCNWVRIAYNRFTVFFKKGDEKKGTERPVSTPSYRFVISQEALLCECVQEWFEKHPNAKPTVLEALAAKHPQFNYDSWLKFEMKLGLRLPFTKLFLILIARDVDTFRRALEDPIVLEEEFGNAGAVFKGVHSSFNPTLPKADVEHEQVEKKTRARRTPRPPQPRSVSSTSFSKPAKATVSQVLNSQGFMYTLNDLMFWNSFQLTSLGLPGYFSFQVKHGKSISKLDMFSCSRLDDGKSFTFDAIISSNGPVYCLGWCPHYVSERSSKILACHSPSDNMFHKIHDRTRTKQCIQFWEVFFPEKSEKNTTHISSPKLVMCFVFNRASIRQFKWFPGNSLISSPPESKLERIGVIAICFRDGFVGVYSVPNPHTIATSRSDGVVICTPTALVSWSPLHYASTLCLEWSRVGDNAVLFSGGSDGSVRVHLLETVSEWADANRPHLSRYTCKTVVYQCFDEFAPVRSITCSPENVNLFIAGSEQGVFGVWDLRSPENALFTFTESTGSPVRNLWWMFGEPICVCGTDIGMRFFSLTDFSCRSRSPFGEFCIDDSCVHDMSFVQVSNFVYALVVFDNGTASFLSCASEIFGATKDSFKGVGQLLNVISTHTASEPGVVAKLEDDTAAIPNSHMFEVKTFPTRRIRRREESRAAAKLTIENAGKLSFVDFALSDYIALTSCDLTLLSADRALAATGGRGGIIRIQLVQLPDPYS